MSTPPTLRTLCSLLSLAVPLGFVGCDNVGRAFGPAGKSGGTATEIQAIVAEGFTVDGRPKVVDVFPKGNGWPGTVPIVVIFNETVAADAVAPTTGTPNLFVRQKVDSSSNQGGLGGGQGGGGGSTPLPASYDFLLGGRVVVIRPSAAFDPAEANTYEVVIKPELRDIDGLRFGGSDEKIVATFTADKANEVADSRILTVLPVDNGRDALRQSPIYAVFTRPAITNTVNPTTGPANFIVRPDGGANLDGKTSFPIRAGGTGAALDGRVVEFVPSAPLAGNADYEIVVDGTIAFASSGKLDFRGRTPYARFRTTAAAPPLAVTVGNGTPGATDKVNRNNLETLRLDVDLPADTLAGDQVLARIYGLDKNGGTTNSVNFVEVSAAAPAAGAQTVGVSFAGRLGTVAEPEFLEGALLFGAEVVRGGRSSGYVLSSSTTGPALDVTPPELSTPAADSAGNRTVYTDQEQLVFFGTAAEDLSTASLVLDATPAPAPGATTGTLFGVGSGGRFMFEPIQLGRRTAPLGFSLTITDAAGNESAPITGAVVQRGVVTGSVAAGTLVVEAYDDATFLPVSGATVVIEPGLPTAPATGRQTGTTGSDGRAVFAGLAGPTWSITLVRDGYDLISVLDTGASFVSLPLRPLSGATATVRGTLGFTAGTGQSARVGCSIIDDIQAETIATTTTSPTTIPPTAVRPNRPYVLSAFGGTFEPTGKPAFSSFGISIGGPTGIVPEAPLTPLAPGATGESTLVLLPSATTARDLAAPFTKDLATWTGLDTARLTGTPTVRVMASLFGVPQMTAVGIGFATQSGATASYSIDARYSLSAAAVMAKLLPKFWVSTQATDADGTLARHRRIIDNPPLGTTFASAAVPAIGTITAPAGPSTDSPSVTYQDRLDVAAVPATLGFHVITATSGTRSWRVLRQDRTGATGAMTVQLPVFAGVSATGLAAGAWRIRTETHLVFSLTMALDDFALEEIRREEVTYARTGETVFTVN